MFMLKKSRFLCLFIVFLLVFSSLAVFTAAGAQADKEPKYIFLFIGDGMGLAQVKAAEYYNGWKEYGLIQKKPFNFSEFPVFGIMDIYANDAFIPSSDAAGTSIATGYKTNDRKIGLAPDGTKLQSIAKLLQKKGMQIGIITTVELNDATPAAFYANAEDRGMLHDIAFQLADSGFNFFSGPIAKATEDEWVNDGLPPRQGVKVNAYDYAVSKGYRVLNKRSQIEALSAKDDKVIVSVADEYLVQINWNEPGHQYYIDKGANNYTLADAVRKGIDVMSDSKNGYFMMAELGRLDWALHENDAATAIKEMQGLHDAIAEALKVYAKYPDETLIIVTGDHETGGMTIGYAATEYKLNLDLIDHQKISGENFYILFDKFIQDAVSNGQAPRFEKIKPEVTKNFGLKFEGDPDDDVMILKPEEVMLLKEAFDLNVTAKSARNTNAYGYKAKWGSNSYEPFTTMCLRLLQNRVGIGFTTFQHTTVPVPVYALGVGSEKFAGNIDNTDIFWNLSELCNVGKKP